MEPADGSEPTTLDELMVALAAEALKPVHEPKSWGDWIMFEDLRIVLSLEVRRGIVGAATLEHPDELFDPEDEQSLAVFRAFDALGWIGNDDNGRFALIS